MFPFISYLSLQLFVCSVYLTNTGRRRERSYNPTVRYSDSPIVRHPTGPAIR
jgi:hypothetical protein